MISKSCKKMYFINNMTVKHNMVKFKHFCMHFALIFNILFVLQQKKNILVDT